jgi:hypothetical protein
MTAQTPDVIILDKSPFNLHTTPLESYFERIRWRPSFNRRCTANRRGYVARWELFGERLFLTGLFGMDWIVPPHLLGTLPPDPEPYEATDDRIKTLRLHDIFPDQAPLVFAEWVSEPLVVPTGPQLVYVHAGFGSLYATYRTFDVLEGRVRSFRNWTAREWASATGHDWLLDKLTDIDSQPVAQREQDATIDGGGADDDLGDWRGLDDPNDRMFAYEVSQIDKLWMPCGQVPPEE